MYSSLSRVPSTNPSFEGVFHLSSIDGLEEAWKAHSQGMKDGVERVIGPSISILRRGETKGTPPPSLTVLSEIGLSKDDARSTLTKRLIQTEERGSLIPDSTKSAYAMRFYNDSAIIKGNKAKRMKTLVEKESKKDDTMGKKMEKAKEKRRLFLEKISTKIFLGKGEFIKCPSCSSRFLKSYLVVNELPMCPLCEAPCISPSDKERLAKLDEALALLATSFKALPHKFSWLVVSQ